MIYIGRFVKKTKYLSDMSVFVNIGGSDGARQSAVLLCVFLRFSFVH